MRLFHFCVKWFPGNGISFGERRPNIPWRWSMREEEYVVSFSFSFGISFWAFDYLSFSNQTNRLSVCTCGSINGISWWNFFLSVILVISISDIDRWHGICCIHITEKVTTLCATRNNIPVKENSLRSTSMDRFFVILVTGVGRRNFETTCELVAGLVLFGIESWNHINSHTANYRVLHLTEIASNNEIDSTSYDSRFRTYSNRMQYQRYVLETDKSLSFRFIEFDGWWTLICPPEVNTEKLAQVALVQSLTKKACRLAFFFDRIILRFS